MEEISNSRTAGIEEIVSNNSSNKYSNEFLVKQYQEKYHKFDKTNNNPRILLQTDYDEEDYNTENKFNESEIKPIIKKLAEISDGLKAILEKSDQLKTADSVRKYIVDLIDLVDQSLDNKLIPESKNRSHKKNISPFDGTNYQSLNTTIKSLKSGLEKKPTKDLISGFLDLFNSYSDGIIATLINDGLGVSIQKLEQIIGLIDNLAKVKPYDPNKICYIEISDEDKIKKNKRI